MRVSKPTLPWWLAALLGAVAIVYLALEEEAPPLALGVLGAALVLAVVVGERRGPWPVVALAAVLHGVGTEALDEGAFSYVGACVKAFLFGGVLAAVELLRDDLDESPRGWGEGGPFTSRPTRCRAGRPAPTSNPSPARRSTRGVTAPGATR